MTACQRQYSNKPFQSPPHQHRDTKFVVSTKTSVYCSQLLLVSDMFNLNSSFPVNYSAWLYLKFKPHWFKPHWSKVAILIGALIQTFLSTKLNWARAERDKSLWVFTLYRSADEPFWCIGASNMPGTKQRLMSRSRFGYWKYVQPFFMHLFH